jgi:hypothetical protein
VITLGGRSFNGPFLLPLWSPLKGAGLYAVMVAGWRLLTFRAIHFGAADDFAAQGLLQAQQRYAEWVSIAGTEWSLYVATHEMFSSTRVQREAAEREVLRAYKPEFAAPTPSAEQPDLRTMLLARALRANLQE